MKRLENKTAIITGAARGMGAATARLFAAEGARVLITDVLDAEGEALARELGDAALFRHHDVADEEQWQRVLQDAVARFGGIDVLVNNAGVLLMRGLLDITKQDFERVLGINLVGTFLGIKTVAPSIIERGGGAIVNISSIDGLKGSNATARLLGQQMGRARAHQGRGHGTRPARRARELDPPGRHQYPDDHAAGRSGRRRRRASSTRVCRSGASAKPRKWRA